jgi:4-hydroxy-tetrahydrodipicolinate synthase
MASYTRAEARDWAKEHLKGVINVIIPSFTSDLERVNEAAIRNDVQKQLEYGFDGALLVSEVVQTLDEYAQFSEIAADEAKGRQKFVHHSAWSNLDQAKKALKVAESTGSELVLLTYPPSFYPTSEQDIYDYTKSICDATDLGILLFPVPTWGFSRIHPAQLSANLLRRLIDDCPNIVAIKAEGTAPTPMGLIEVYRKFGDEIVVSCPIEAELIPLGQIMPIELSATSDHEYYGPMIPRVMKHLRAGEFDGATEIFYQLEPGRKAKGGIAPVSHGLGLINRTVWKYQAWLQGYSGGSLRHPTMRIQEPQMNALRRGLADSGLNPTKDPNSEFFVGRFPEG